LRRKVKNKVRTCVSHEFLDSFGIADVANMVPGDTPTEFQLVEKRGICGRLQRETVHFRAQGQKPFA
jgi:hypothetical protein